MRIKCKHLLTLLSILFLPLVNAQSEDAFSSALDLLKGFGFWTLIIIGGIIVLGLVLVGVLFWRHQKKQWYLKVEFKLIRSDGKAVLAEWGKGFYDSKKGILWVKRPKMRKESIKATDMRLYLQGSDVVTVVGNTGNWKPVIPQSFLEVIDDTTGEVASIMQIRVDMKEDKPWAVQTERMLEDAFSIATFWNSMKDYLGWGLVIFIVIIANAVQYYLNK